MTAYYCFLVGGSLLMDMEEHAANRPWRGRWHKRWFVVPSVCTANLVLLGLIIGAAVVAARQAYSGLDWLPSSGKVQGVELGSPAAVAGLRPGDVILALGNESGNQAGASIADWSAGETVVMSVSRQEQPWVTRLTLTSPPPLALLKRLIPLVIALSFGLFSFHTWIHKPSDRMVILFLVPSQLGAAGLTLGALSSLDHRWASRGFGPVLYALSVVLVHFHLSFPRPKALPGKRMLIAGLYGLALFLSAPYGLDWLNLHRPGDGRWYALAHSGARLFFASASLAVATVLLHTYLTTPSPGDRRRIRLVVFGTVLAFAPLVGLALLPEVLSGTPLVAYEFTFPGLLLIPLAYAIAIRRHDLLPIDRLVNRGAVHLTLLLILALVYLGLALALPRLGLTTWVEQPLAWGLITLLVAVLFAPLRSRLQTIADRLFYGGWYDYRSVVSEMSQALGGIVDAAGLADLLVERLAETLRLRRAALLLPGDQETLAPVESTGWWSDELPAFPLPRAGALAHALCRAAQPLTPPELRAALTETSLTEAERWWLSHPDLALWVPLVRSEKLQGLLLLGARPGEEPFDAEDRRLLSTLAWNAAVAAENVQLFEALRRRAEEVNRLYTQLTGSREEERKRLARELHDQVIQDLINLHYHLDADAPRLAPTVRGQAAALQARTQALIDALRRVCTQLRPAALDDLDLGLAVDGYVEEVAGEWGLPITLRLPPNRHAVLAPVPEDIRVCLFRALQEALTNVHRHARATQVHVELAVEPGYVTLEVRDDGQGFQGPTRLGALIQAGHFGLAGLQERLNMVGGSLEVGPAPGRGTALRARVPWDGEANSTGE